LAASLFDGGEQILNRLDPVQAFVVLQRLVKLSLRLRPEGDRPCRAAC
jgi:hypothetical protein